MRPLNCKWVLPIIKKLQIHVKIGYLSAMLPPELMADAAGLKHLLMLCISL